MSVTQRSLRTTANGQYGQVPIGSLDSLSTVTVSALVKRSAAPAYTQYVAFRPAGFWIAITSGGGVQFGIYTASTGTWTYANATSANFIPVGQWHEIRGVYERIGPLVPDDGRLRERLPHRREQPCCLLVTHDPVAEEVPAHLVQDLLRPVELVEPLGGGAQHDQDENRRNAQGAQEVPQKSGGVR